MRGGRFELACGVALALVACARKPADATPEGAVDAFLEAIDRSSVEPAATARAFALLAPSARQALAAHATRATTLTGKTVTPESMLVVVWSPPRFGVERESARIDADGAHAIVDVYGVDPAAQHAEIHVEREGDRWRIDLDVPP